MSGRLANKIALVTGGANGLGRAIVERFAAEGAAVVLTDVDAVAGETLAKAVNGLFVRHDVADEAQWQAVIAAVRARHGKLHVLVNNAGVSGSLTKTEDVSLADWRRLMSINVDGVFLGLKHGIPLMRDSGGGSIVNLSSVAGKVGVPRMAAYSASKGAVALLTKSVALECARWNIRVNSVHPGFTQTAMVDNHINEQRDPEKSRQIMAASHPIGRIGRPEEIAAGVLYLASDESSFSTGSELVLDGGLTAA